jgi:dihydrofolate reductase
LRKVVSYFVYSLDGVVHDPQDWVYDRFDEQMVGHLKALIDRQDAVLLGRTTYEAWLSYWPTSTHEPFASFINSTPKYIASTTLDEVTWQNSTLIKENVADEIARLKEEPGKDIGIHGSATLARSLLQPGLIDELKLAVFPAVAGKGARLFDGFNQLLRLRLATVERTDKGVLFLTFEPRSD